MSTQLLEQCPLCQAPASELETLTGVRVWFCNCCAKTFALDLEGRVLQQVPTQHRQRRRQTDVSGNEMDGQ